jgi:hypothetical protein
MKRAPRRAFTPVELLVVVAIMGFLAAMVAPKLYGILDSSRTSIDDANQRELEKNIGYFIMQNHRLPGGLVSVVHERNEGSVRYEMPVIDSASEGEVDLSPVFADRLLPGLHRLNAAEVRELKEIGLGKVRVYRRSFSGGREEYGVETELKTGLAVLMVGGGAPDQRAKIAWAESRAGSIFDNGRDAVRYDPDLAVALDGGGDYARMDGAPYLGRIILGLDDSGELVRRNYLKTAGTSPTAEDGVRPAFLNYVVLLPRLRATEARMVKNELEIRRYDREVTRFRGVLHETMGRAEKQRLPDIAVLSAYGENGLIKSNGYGVKIR